MPQDNPPKKPHRGAAPKKAAKKPSARRSATGAASFKPDAPVPSGKKKPSARGSSPQKPSSRARKATGASRSGEVPARAPRASRSEAPRSARPTAARPASSTPRAPRSAAARPDAPRSARAEAPRTARPTAARPTSSAPRTSRPAAPRPTRSSDGAPPRAPRSAPRDSGSGAPASRAPRRDAPTGRSGAPTSRAPRQDGPGGRPAPRTGAPSRSGAPTRSGPPRTDGPGRPAGAAPRTPRADSARPARERAPEGPPLPTDADPRLLPNEIRRELRALQDVTADRVAGHLVAAGQLIDDDPAAAYEHAKAAKALAARIGAVREAAGVAAYRAGDFATALADLKAARRITGLPDHLALIADCERALGRPDRALAVAADPDRKRLDRASQVELTIVASGARRDLGQADAAVLALQGPDLDSDAVEPWSVRLWYAYADALLAAGRRDDAVSWFEAAATIDEEGETDAEERLVELSRRAGE